MLIYTIPLSWLTVIPSATSGTATVSVTTYASGGLELGTDTYSFTITAPSSAVPTISVAAARISGSVIIDSVLQEAYQGNVLMNDHMNGEFPVLKPGQNAISWNGTVTKVVVRPNWRYL